MDPFVWCQRSHLISHRRNYPPRKGPIVVRPMLLICLLVNTVETRHCWLLSSRFACGEPCYTRVCGGGVENTVFWEKPRGISPRGEALYLFVTNTPLPLCPTRGQRFPKTKCSPQKALTGTIAVLDLAAVGFPSCATSFTVDTCVQLLLVRTAFFLLIPPSLVLRLLLLEGSKGVVGKVHFRRHPGHRGLRRG